MTTIAAIRRQSTAGTLIYLLFGPIVWAVHLTALYGSQSTLCALSALRSSEALSGAAPVVITIATSVALAVLAAALAEPDAVARLLRASGWADPQRSFHRRVMLLLAMLAVMGVALAGASAWIIPACPQLR